jgi:hypothetical protein
MSLFRRFNMNGHGGARIGSGRKNKSWKEPKEIEEVKVAIAELPENKSSAEIEIAEKINEWLLDNNCLTEISPMQVNQFASEILIYETAKKNVYDNGLTFLTERGTVVTNPNYRIMNTSLDRINKFYNAIYLVMMKKLNHAEKVFSVDSIESLLTFASGPDAEESTQDSVYNELDLMDDSDESADVDSDFDNT